MTLHAVDDALAGEVLDAIGATADDDVAAIVAALRGWLPAGSTAKWAAVDRGAVPPGADPTTALVARLDGSVLAWSCWALCTGLGGLLAALGHDVEVVVEQHRSRTDVVDFHSVVIVDGGEAPGGLVDPYLGPSVPVPRGHDVTTTESWAAWVPADRGDRDDHLGLRGGGSPYRYRFLARDLDRRDIDAFCRVSVNHSGVGRRRMAHWVRAGQLWSVREPDIGRAELRVAEGASPFESTRRLAGTGTYEDLLTAHLG